MTSPPWPGPTDPEGPAAAGPYPGPYPGPPPYPPPYYPPPYYPPPRTNGLAIASLVCAFLFAPLAILFGHLSLSQIKRTGEQGRGLAIAGLVLGYLATVAMVMLLVAGIALFTWAAREVRNNPDFLGSAGRTASGGALPAFAPPAGLGSDCRYPSTATPASKAARPPRAGTVPTDPAVVEATMTVRDGTTENAVVGLRLDNATSPCTVNSFVSLAQQGFFDDTPCHRLTDSPRLSLLQCGDPTATGAGGPGYRFANEYPTNQYRPFDQALRVPVIYPRGTLAMANAGPDSNGSQFFIVYRDSELPPTHTVFGSVDNTGMAVVDRLVADGVAGGSGDGEPKSPIGIVSIRLS